jgi:U3 small nucleolar RNA-associated protein 22
LISSSSSSSSSSQKPFVFRPPTAVTVVGSFAAGGPAGPRRCVDLSVSMPRACFDDKDQLNHRYHAKRALYLAHLVAPLSDLPGVESVAWGHIADDPRRPALVLRPAGGGAAGLTLRVLPAAEPALFPLHRLGPLRNNLRTAKDPKANNAAGKKAGSKRDDGPDAGEILSPTPRYNSSVLQDMQLVAHRRTVAAVSAAAPHFAEAGVLLRSWAEGHHVGAGSDGVSGFLLTMLLAHLVEKGTAVRTARFLQSIDPFHACFVVTFTLLSVSHYLRGHGRIQCAKCG